MARTAFAVSTSPSIARAGGTTLVETVGADNVHMRNTARSRKGRAVPYLPFHQFGTKYMVQSKVMGFWQANLAEIQVVVNAWVASKIGMAA
jgi:hypothetical protein